MSFFFFGLAFCLPFGFCRRSFYILRIQCMFLRIYCFWGRCCKVMGYAVLEIVVFSCCLLGSSLSELVLGFACRLLMGFVLFIL